MCLFGPRIARESRFFSMRRLVVPRTIDVDGFWKGEVCWLLECHSFCDVANNVVGVAVGDAVDVKIRNGFGD